jgi:hypothetical protein
MASVQQVVTLNATAERVWAWLVAPRFYPVWMDQVQAVRDISTPEVGPGTTFVLTRRGRHSPEDWIFAEWQYPDHLRLAEYRGKRQIVFHLEGAATETHLALEHEWSSRGLLPALVPSWGKQRSIARTAERLRELFALNQDIKLLYGMGDE